MFVVYMNRVSPHEHITVHDDQCRYVRQHGGVSDRYPPTGWYCEFFAETRQAHYVANFMADRTGWPRQLCPSCEA